mgnify:CR=1 FL=1
MGNGIETECLLLSAKNCISPTRQPKTFKANYFSLSINYSLFLPFSFCASCINVQPEETIVTVNFIDYNTGRPVASCKGAYSSLGVAGASHDIKGAIISSVVPQLTGIIKEAVGKVTGIMPLTVGPGIKTGLNILMEQPRQLGSDLVVDAVAAIHEYGVPAIIVDIGTATTISVVDDKKNYIGGVIMPGIRVSLDSLVSRTSQLPRISLEAPQKVIGKNTIQCMQSGIIYGNAACIDGMIERIKEETGFSDGTPVQAKVIATGGLAEVIVPECKTDIIYDNALLLKGLKVIYDKNVE